MYLNLNAKDVSNLSVQILSWDIGRVIVRCIFTRLVRPKPSSRSVWSAWIQMKEKSPVWWGSPPLILAALPWVDVAPTPSLVEHNLQNCRFVSVISWAQLFSCSSSSKLYNGRSHTESVTRWAESRTNVALGLASLLRWEFFLKNFTLYSVLHSPPLELISRLHWQEKMAGTTAKSTKKNLKFIFLLGTKTFKRLIMWHRYRHQRYQHSHY